MNRSTFQLRHRGACRRLATAVFLDVKLFECGLRCLKTFIQHEQRTRRTLLQVHSQLSICEQSERFSLVSVCRLVPAQVGYYSNQTRTEANRLGLSASHFVTMTATRKTRSMNSPVSFSEAQAGDKEKHRSRSNRNPRGRSLRTNSKGRSLKTDLQVRL